MLSPGDGALASIACERVRVAIQAERARPRGKLFATGDAEHAGQLQHVSTYSARGELEYGADLTSERPRATSSAS